MPFLLCYGLSKSIICRGDSVNEIKFEHFFHVSKLAKMLNCLLFRWYLVPDNAFWLQMTKTKKKNGLLWWFWLGIHFPVDINRLLLSLLLFNLFLLPHASCCCHYTHLRLCSIKNTLVIPICPRSASCSPISPQAQKTPTIKSAERYKTFLTTPETVSRRRTTNMAGSGSVSIEDCVSDQYIIHWIRLFFPLSLSYTWFREINCHLQEDLVTDYQKRVSSLV